MIAFEKYGRRISPMAMNGKKLLEICFLKALKFMMKIKPIIVKFSKSPKANFMASPDLVRYFHTEKQDDRLHLSNNLKRRIFYISQRKVFIGGSG
jgi:hypothetical protein